MNEELKEIIKKDKLAEQRGDKKYHLFAGGYEKKLELFKIYLRKAEFYYRKHGLFRLIGKYYDVKKNHIGGKLGFSIPLYCFGSGLSIPHYGTIIVNSQAKIGDNCRIQACTVIGQNGDKEGAPVIGDNVYIGANAVVVKNVPDNVVVAGVPAHIISERKV